MKKTTTKEVKKQIQKHIIEFGDFANWEEAKETATSDQFCKTYKTKYELAKEFIEDGNLLYFFDDVRELLKEILEETDEEANKYSDGEVWNLYCHLCARELSK